MTPKITIDQYAIRFEWVDGGKNFFFSDLFRGDDDWHRELMMAIQKSYEICIRKDIKPKED